MSQWWSCITGLTQRKFWSKNIISNNTETNDFRNKKYGYRFIDFNIIFYLPDLMKFAEKMKMGRRIESISLGQGQGPLAENMMKIGCDFGNWVFFQVCLYILKLPSFCRSRIKRLLIIWAFHTKIYVFLTLYIANSIEIMVILRHFLNPRQRQSGAERHFYRASRHTLGVSSLRANFYDNQQMMSQ